MPANYSNYNATF
jgi:hypothetical protein